jgi:hypothetical protein
MSRKNVNVNIYTKKRSSVLPSISQRYKNIGNNDPKFYTASNINKKKKLLQK